MSVVTLKNYLPPERFDGIPWRQAQIGESGSFDGTFATIDTVTFDVPDSDPKNPQERSFTTSNGTAEDMWYTVTFLDAFGGTSIATIPVQNTDTGTPYATVEELFRVLKIRDGGTPEQVAAAEGDLNTASLEINSEIDRASDAAPLTSEAMDLLRGVCIDRAADLWRHRESIPGILGGLDDIAQPMPGRYSFARYVARLSVIKDQWGIA